MFQVTLGEMWKVCLHPERASIHMHHLDTVDDSVSVSACGDMTMLISLSWLALMYIIVIQKGLAAWPLIVNELHLVNSDLVMLSKKED